MVCMVLYGKKKHHPSEEEWCLKEFVRGAMN